MGGHCGAGSRCNVRLARLPVDPVVVYANHFHNFSHLGYYVNPG